MLQVPHKLHLLYYKPELEHQPCRNVQKNDCPSLPELIDKMLTLCEMHDGVGLAAPQVGIFIRLAVVINNTSKPLILINPEITNFAGKDILENESCLSIPPAENEARVWRSEIIQLQNSSIENLNILKKSIHKNGEARVIQHEIDHLDPSGGVFFINRIGAVGREIVLHRYKKYLRENENMLSEVG